MSEDSHDPKLLAQQISTQSDEIARLREAHSKSEEKLNHSQGVIKFLGVLGPVSLVAFGAVFWGGQQSSNSRITQLETENATQKAELKAQNDFILDIRNRKMSEMAQVREMISEHEDTTGHFGVIRLEEKHLALRNSFDSNEGKFEDIATKLSSHEGKIERALMLTEKLEDRLKATESMSNSNKGNISAIAGMASANFVEVESQLRGIEAVRNVDNSWRDALLQLIANNPDITVEGLEIFRSADIPAKATTTPGRIDVNSNGK